MSSCKNDNPETLLAAATILLTLSPMLDPVIICCIAAGLLTITLAGRLLRRSGRGETLQ